MYALADWWGVLVHVIMIERGQGSRARGVLEMPHKYDIMSERV